MVACTKCGAMFSQQCKCLGIWKGDSSMFEMCNEFDRPRAKEWWRVFNKPEDMRDFVPPRHLKCMKKNGAIIESAHKGCWTGDCAKSNQIVAYCYKMEA